MRALFPLLPALVLLTACNSGGGETAGDAITKNGGAFAAIGDGETLRFTGTEPFWGGSVTGQTLIWTTPENPDGTTIQVQRFAGNNGLGFTGNLGGSSFDMAVTQAPCSDGMSDRTYPFTVTLRLSGDVRNGCGWTDARPFEGPEAP